MNANEPSKPKLLLTGGCGRIGSYFARFAAERYAIRVVDKAAWDAERLGDLPIESQVCDLQDLAACLEACEGMDMVVHLAADPSPAADFMGSLLGNNILATYNIFRAAKEAGCKRIVFASSVHAVASYPRDVQIGESMPVQPTSLYGVSKCFGEALAAHFGVNEGLPSIAIRIGSYLSPEELGQVSPNEIDGFLHPDDFNHLLVRCLETPDIHFAIVHGISDNRYKRLDLTETRRVLGYRPQADAFDLLGIFPGETS
jgi:nucleoside-diphosphate-sugar epimerase